MFSVLLAGPLVKAFEAFGYDLVEGGVEKRFGQHSIYVDLLKCQAYPSPDPGIALMVTVTLAGPNFVKPFIRQTTFFVDGPEEENAHLLKAVPNFEKEMLKIIERGTDKPN